VEGVYLTFLRGRWRVQGRAKELPRGPQENPRPPEMAPRMLQDCPRGSPNQVYLIHIFCLAFQTPQEPPKRSENRGGQERRGGRRGTWRKALFLPLSNEDLKRTIAQPDMLSALPVCYFDLKKAREASSRRTKAPRTAKPSDPPKTVQQITLRFGRGQTDRRTDRQTDRQLRSRQLRQLRSRQCWETAQTAQSDSCSKTDRADALSAQARRGSLV
jgi:hypothetical protein